jgi:hypothetical protein
MVILRGGSSFFNIAIKGGYQKLPGNMAGAWGGGSLKSFLMFSFAFKF